MAKIIKVGSQNPTFTSNDPNLAKTSRTGNITNPFKFTNFEGNTLQFADVFEGFDSKKTDNVSFKGSNKLKMIASSVTGSMNKMRSGISESVINFVNRVRGAWDYAKNTNVSDLAAVKAFNNVMNTEIKLPSINMGGITDSISNMGKDISDKLSFLNKDVKIPTINIDGIASKLDFLNTDITDIGKDMADKWSNMISKVHTKKISANTPVEELEQLWKGIIDSSNLESKEVA